MPQPKKGATTNGSSPKKPTRAQAAKAIAEMKDKPRTGDFRGVKLTLPAQLPATFIFDVAEMQAADENETDISVFHTLMVSLLGREQWQAVRRKIGADGDAWDDLGSLMEEIFAAITGAYGGVELGESEASVTS